MSTALDLGMTCLILRILHLIPVVSTKRRSEGRSYMIGTLQH